MAEKRCGKQQKFIRALEVWNIINCWMREPYESRGSRTVLEEAFGGSAGGLPTKQLHLRQSIPELMKLG